MIRKMTSCDIKEVLNLEKIYFNSGSKENLEKCLTSETYAYYVLIQGGKIIGYSAYLLSGDDSEIVQIVVDKEYRKMGYGKKLLESGINEMKKLNKNSIFLEVRVSNMAARNLYLGAGFKEINVRKNYYGNEDAVIMSLNIN